MRDFISSGFFAMRTPFLPFEELLAWSDGLEAAVLTDPNELEAALVRDRERLVGRLRVILSRPEVTEAIFLASPHLVDAIADWVREPDTERGPGIQRAALRYFTRMTTRPTPFGLFAGCSIGSIDRETKLVLAARSEYRRHTRLRLDYLVELTNALSRDKSLRDIFIYRTNSSLYCSGGRIRYVTSRVQDSGVSYHLVFAETTDYLLSTLTRAEPGASFDSLATALTGPDVSREAAAVYIEELIESQILVADIALHITGAEATQPLANQLRHPLTNRVAEGLETAAAELSAIDHRGASHTPGNYTAVFRALADLPVELNSAKPLFEADMIKPVVTATLSQPVISEIAHAVDLLRRLQSPFPQGALAGFRDRFSQRYEMREVPLFEALDEEDGIGFDSARDATPLLDRLDLSPVDQETEKWGTREKVLLQKIGEAARLHAREIILSRHDIETMAVTKPADLPDAFAAAVTLVAASEAEVARGNFRIVLRAVLGPSGATWLSRFGHADPELQKRIEAHLRAEEALQPEAIFAEIVHLPSGHSGFLCRPAPRRYEIPYLARASVPASHQIPVSDLTVSLRGDRVVLRSIKLGREIIPRLTAAHNVGLSTLGVYKFLSAVQNQGSIAGNLMWAWGALDAAEFLPRVASGRVILHHAQWRVGGKELTRLTSQRAEGARFAAIQQWRNERQLPRWVAVADSDNVLPIDLDNVLSVEMFLHLVKNSKGAVLTELLPGFDELLARGSEGKFFHELIVPFVKASPVRDSFEKIAEPSASTTRAKIVRTFPPGSEWLYAKLYCGPIAADDLLQQTIAPFVRGVLASGAADQWFFIRYADPDAHLRLRFHGSPERLHQEILPSLQKILAPLIAEENLRSWQLDTYHREVERYGGPEGLLLAERLFQVDSETVLEILPLFNFGDEGLEERWQLALVGVDFLLNDFGYNLSAKSNLVDGARAGLANRFRNGHDLKNGLSEKFRRERSGLEELLGSTQDPENSLVIGLKVLERRSERLVGLIKEFTGAVETGQLQGSLDNVVASVLHMSVNRLLRSMQPEQEFVIYDFLDRLYRSRVARAGERLG